jgi:hypothetical protein
MADSTATRSSTKSNERSSASRNEDTTGLVDAEREGVNFDDEKARETQRKRNADLASAPPFSGDKEYLLAGGVPRQLVEGNDPDAKLTD